MGVAEHKRRKNEACSRGLLERYAADDYVGVQLDAGAKIASVPKPAGVVLALTPSTNPIATVYFKVLLALMTRNAVVVSPHPLARRVCAEAVHLLSRAAVEAVVTWVRAHTYRHRRASGDDLRRRPDRRSLRDGESRGGR